ncbi:transglutaminase TgpA family protein [Alkalimarinus coralli]|uniref:transglutaminase TgpA family protein n=1 Tax=Alkalimarinus coralli TaxID=2935863 RepID=UPI00202AF822|nr:DUF3488 and DUF4129 domain-containing transglutaminase family protein [Alkalimarinus coralli]
MINSVEKKTSNQTGNAPLIPRGSLFLLMIAFLSVMLPHYANIEAWLVVCSVGVALWRASIFRGWLSFPNSSVKTLLVLIAIGAFYLTYRQQYTVESAVAFFVLAVSLKLIEVKFTKDCYLFVFILLYLCACQFLFSQTFLTALYQLFATCIVLSVLFSLHKGRLNVPSRVRVFELSKLLVISVPLVISIFVFFPRIAPLWSIPLSTGKAQTGISDSMSPGEIAELTQSAARAFRIEFTGEAPPRSQLYWRGLELDLLEGNTWRSSELISGRFLGRLDEVRTTNTKGKNSYDILIEPTNNRWGYALASSDVASNNIYINERGFVRFKNNIIQPTRYRLSYEAPNIGDRALGAPLGKTQARSLSRDERRRYLQLPLSGNPKTRLFVTELLNQRVSQSFLIQRLMSYFRVQPFYYTLKPPLTNSDFFDDFLFNTRKGFCSHYAGSLVYMLRLAKIPSRVVVGYQGGEVNEQEGYLIVHQYDAHAWVEVWSDDAGWVRYDPTAMVAPERIENGLEQAVREEGSFLSGSAFSSARYNQIGVIRWMRLKLDSVNYNWQKWVVGYDGQTQLNFLSRWFGAVTFQTLALIMTLVAGLVIGIAFWVLSADKKRGPVNKVVLEFERFCKAAEKSGMTREVGETPNQFTDRLAERFPEQKESLAYISRCFNYLQYSRTDDKNEQLRLLNSMKVKSRKLLKAIKKSAK